MPPTLTLIIVTHNSTRWLPSLFNSWRHAAANFPHEIIIADAGSTDETISVASTLCRSARILSCGNIGYGAAINRAVAVTSTPWLLLCNPDLQFPANFAESFLYPMTTSPPDVAGCSAPDLLNDDGTPQPSAGRFPTISGLLRDQLRTPSDRKYVTRSNERFFDWATGACLLLRRDHFHAVGGFDEKFFLYVEEVDLQKRLAALGLHTFLQRNVGVLHLAPQASREPAPYIRLYSARGTLRYFAKHGTPIQLLAYRVLAILSRRIPPKEALAPKQKILDRPTGP